VFADLEVDDAQSNGHRTHPFSLPKRDDSVKTNFPTQLVDAKLLISTIPYIHRAAVSKYVMYN